jgi:hypothetical protein
VLELAKQALLIGVPTALMIAGAAALLAECRFRWAAQRIRGRVVGHQERPDDEDPRRSMYQSIVEFHDGGQTRRIADSSSYGWKIDRLDSEVQILFPSGRPDQARIARQWPLVIYAVLILAGGAGLCLSFTRM